MAETGQLTSLRPVGPFARALALAIDELIRWTLIASGAVALASMNAFDLGTLLLMVAGVYWSYGVIFDVLAAGQTPGKRMQRIRVVNADGTSVRVGASLIRNLFLIVDALPFAYLLGLSTLMVSRDFRRIGDHVAGTRVIYCAGTREPWEAADFGCAALRRSPGLLYGAWFATALPIFALIAVLLWAYPATSGVLLWWLKPLYERLPTWMLSQRMLGRSPTLREAFSNWRQIRVGLVPALTYRRLSPTRSFDASVDILEAVHGSRRRGRLALLHQGSGAPAFWLTVICAHIEAFLVVGAMAALLLLLIPRDFDMDLVRLLILAGDDRFDWASNLMYLIAIGSVGPIYAAAGATLYLNRRAELHGGPDPFAKSI